MKQKTQIGSYELISLLGSGGMAEVYLARKSFVNGQDKLFALKKTLPDYLDSPDLQKMFFDEMKLAACLSHKNIVQTIDFGIIDAQAFFVMELIQGISLRELLGYLRDKNEDLPIPMVLYILKQVLDALEYAYQVCDPETGQQLKLIHRDISPHNIMLTFEGEIKVIDFGIAKVSVAAQQTQHGILKGKIAYMSPEQANSLAIDSRSDLFSVGIILWELLTNRRFFHGSNADEVKRAVRSFRFENLDFKVSDRLEELRGIISQLLHHDKENRFSSAKDASKAINLYLNREYPQFSEQQFSLLLKNTFKERYKESIERIKEAKTDPLLVRIEKTILTKKSLLTKAKPLVIKPVIRRKKVVSTNSRFPFSLGQVILSFMLLGLGYSVYKYQRLLIKKVDTIRAAYSPKPVLQELLQVQFSVSPRDAVFSLNGAPIKLEKLGQGIILKKGHAYQIDVEKDGYVTRSFKFAPIKSANYHLELQKLPSLSNLVAAEKRPASSRLTKKKKNRATASH